MEGKNSILIADDEKSNLLYLSQILGRDYTIYTARDAEEAIQKANEYLPDIILLDIIMPGMDGYEALVLLKQSQITKNIPVIFITGLDSSSDEQKGLVSGAQDYITKPFSDAIVKLRVKNQIKIINQMRTLDKRLEQQTLMASIAQSFLKDECLDSLFGKTLSLIGEKMEISQVMLYRIDEDEKTLICRSEWKNPGQNTGIITEQKIKMTEPVKMNINNMQITMPVYNKGRVCAVLYFQKQDDNEWTESEINLTRLTSGIFSGVFEREAIEHDLNAVLRLKADLIVAKEKAEQSSRAKGEFLSRMSHEMRTPLNAIIGMTTLAKNTDDREKKKDYLIKADKASHVLLKLIDDVLDISAFENGKFSLAMSKFSFREMLNRLYELSDLYFNEKHQEFSAVIDPEIPDCIYGDERRLFQVISNLFSNAGKFNKEHGTIRLNAFLAEKGEDFAVIQVEISDDGIGITKEQMEKLFTAFEQADGGTNRRYQGAGLGLAISKKIVEMMDGRIWAESEPGRGSKFSFTFKTQIYASDQCNDNFSDYNGKTLLLAEDVEINRELVIAMLEDTQMEIQCARNGREAVDLFSSDPVKYDLILMDINMPEMDGVQATREIRTNGTARGKQVPIIAMTANVLPEEIDKYLSAGMTDHIGKPIDFGRLRNMVSSYIE